MDPVGDVLNRPRLYYNIDGLGELGGGVLALGIALFLSLRQMELLRWRT